MANPVSFSTTTKTFFYNLPGNIQNAAKSVTAKLQKNAPFIIAQVGSYFTPAVVTGGSLAVILLSGTRTSKDSKIQIICGIATSILIIKVCLPVAIVSVFCMSLLRDDILKNDQIKKHNELEKQLNENETKEIDTILTKDLNAVASSEKNVMDPIKKNEESSESDSESENEKLKNFKKPVSHSSSHDSSGSSEDPPELVKPLNLNDPTEFAAQVTSLENQEIEKQNESNLNKEEEIEETITGEDFDGYPAENLQEKIRDSFNDTAVDF